MTADQKVPMGLAIPLPMMSKAEPWIGSNIEGGVRSGLRLAVGAMPKEPASAAARSDRMSACRLVATIVSSVSGLSVIRMVIASTSILSQVTSGNSWATPAGILTFRVLAHDHPVQLLGGHVAQRAGDAGQDPCRPDIGVLVERLAD